MHWVAVSAWSSSRFPIWYCCVAENGCTILLQPFCTEQLYLLHRWSHFFRSNNVCFLAPEPLVQLRCSSKKSTHIKARHSDTEDVMEGKLAPFYCNLLRIKISKEKERFPNDAEQLQKHARRIERDTPQRACGALATAGRPTYTRGPFFCWIDLWRCMWLLSSWLFLTNLVGTGKRCLRISFFDAPPPCIAK